MKTIFHGKLALQQRVLPNYRVPFFELLNSACEGGMSLFTGLPRRSEGITTTDKLRITYYRLDHNIHLFGGSLYLCYQRGLTDWLKEWNPDALIVEANPRYLSTPSAVKWMHKQNKPVIGWGLGSPPVRGLRQQGRLAFLRQFDAMICYSQRGADEYAREGFPLDNLFVAHNSVSPAPAWLMPDRPKTFNPSTRLRQSGQAQPCILFVGRLQFRKNVDLLLGACAEMESQPRLVIVGDGPERDALESLASEIYPATEFVGAKHGAELKPYFTEADLFVLPGTGGLAVQEAMSYGLPVIVAQGDGTQDDLVRKENGWQIPPDDFDTLLSTMKDALSDVARLRTMGEESYRIVKEEINIEKMVGTFVKALNSLRGK
ncbi:MAG: glycosyltransferase family 4 protein [Anaerolineae bacterium]|nr:glycosyltransferase family 4 protein [Anaerolineae bacterium]MCI0609192.1 glycosyltransferase family 4 protein [Anaerolineae bacterium]